MLGGIGLAATLGLHGERALEALAGLHMVIHLERRTRTPRPGPREPGGELGVREQMAEGLAWRPSSTSV